MATQPQVMPSTFPIVDRLLVHAGVPLFAITSFASSSGLSLAEICDIVIPARTLQHRRARNENLSRDESDKFARLVRLFGQAVAVFGSQKKALWWLREPQITFEGNCPLDFIKTEIDGRAVEEALIQIDEGIYP